MKFPDGVMLETERLFIRPLNEEEMKNLADSYIEKDSKMYKAYSEMLELSKGNPEDYLWYTAWGFFTKESGKSSSLTLDKVNFSGNVKIVTKDATVTADRGTYFPQSGIVKLFDNVTINQSGNILHGDKAETNLNTGISKLLAGSKKGRVKGVFKEKK